MKCEFSDNVENQAHSQKMSSKDASKTRNCFQVWTAYLRGGLGVVVVCINTAGSRILHGNGF